MTRTKIIIVSIVALVLVLVSGVVIIHMQRSTNEIRAFFPDVDAIACMRKPNTHISTNSDALCFFMNVDGLADSLRAAQQDAKYEGWMVIVHRRKEFDGWEVRFHSKGTMLPAYVCTRLFTENGDPVNLKQPCGYIK